MKSLKRVHLFEFGDQPWISGKLRTIYNEALNIGQRAGGQYRKMASAFHQWSTRCRADKVLDLASGGGAPLMAMMDSARAAGTELPQLICSDLFPDRSRLERLRRAYGADRLDFIETPVSALERHPELPLARSICSALHHFSPDAARRIVESSLSPGGGLFILEPFTRDWHHLFVYVLLGPWVYMAAPFFARRFSPATFLLCTVIPVVPFMIYWDGIVSVLRVHTPEEIRKMIPSDLEEEVFMEFGYVPYLLGCRAMYVALSRRPDQASENMA